MGPTWTTASSETCSPWAQAAASTLRRDSVAAPPTDGAANLGPNPSAVGRREEKAKLSAFTPMAGESWIADMDDGQLRDLFSLGSSISSAHPQKRQRGCATG